MPDTFREVSTTEIAISTETFNNLASGAERRQEGDIIAVRKPSLGIGEGEMSTRLWLHVIGLDRTQMEHLTHLVGEPFREDGEYGLTAVEEMFDKRRFNIPLERLQKFKPTLDLNRVRDPLDIYQPFLNIEEDTGFFLNANRPLPVNGLIYDKVFQRFF